MAGTELLQDLDVVDVNPYAFGHGLGNLVKAHAIGREENVVRIKTGQQAHLNFLDRNRVKAATQLAENMQNVEVGKCFTGEIDAQAFDFIEGTSHASILPFHRVGIVNVNRGAEALNDFQGIRSTDVVAAFL